jgi:Ser/Thr protein kinase RdoA (MazF antagonist)
VLDGPSLVHLDVRSDNVGFAGDRAVIVDWNWAHRGNPTVDIAVWLPSLHAEGGPAPETVLPDETELAAMISGFWASRAVPPAGGMGAVSPLRRLQRELLATALSWAIRSLALPALPEFRLRQ